MVADAIFADRRIAEIEVVGVDLAAASLRVARSKSEADAVRWILGARGPARRVSRSSAGIE
jgi:ubiquinone/menaquinone biosynthesis C-methylase UbiE